VKNSSTLGFTLIELLVTVAILGILAAIAIVSYNGYVGSAKKKSTMNVMQQISLGQTEYFSENGEYYTHNSSEPSCAPNDTTSGELETNLLGDADVVTEDMGFYLCAHKDGAKFKVVALESGVESNKCQIEMTWNGTFSKGQYC
tara:strand:+ start:1541 stop:1972 length:432 start_codon:yes stop_codon:yes gene_type:complete